MVMKRYLVAPVTTLCLVVFACSSSSNNGSAPNTGGKAGPGGAASGGGSVAAGGSAVTGGSSTSSGTVASGGSAPNGGTTAGSGGTTPTGGTATTGGTMPTGGTTSGSGGLSAGGTTATGGAIGTGGSTPLAVTCTAEYTGSETRPQLTDASAACFTVQNYLAEAGTIGALVRDSWDPSAGLPPASSYTPTYTVAADGSGTHTTVQDAITAANGSGNSTRVYILVKPGSYRELVSRANGLYDQAAAAAQINDMAAAQRYGKAAAAVYAAAWSKQPGDPSVGTDWAHVLFFAGEFQAAVARVDAVLKADPGFQKGWVNKGDFLWNLAQMTTDQSQAAQYSAQAKAAYQRALRLGPATKPGQYAAAQLKALK